MRSKPVSNPLRITVIYLVFGGLWIIFSDTVLGLLIPHSSATYPLAQTIKGWLFVIAGAVFLYVILSADMKAFKKQEEAQQESQAQFRTLMRRMSAITYSASADDPDSILSISPQIEALLGFSPMEYEKDPQLWQKQIHPADRGHASQAMRENQKSYGSFAREYRMTGKDGSVVWIRDQSILVEDEEGRAPYYESYIQDITERKQAEIALRDSQARLSSMVDSAMDAIITLDENQRIILFNPAAESMFNISGSEVMGQPLDRFIPERYREAHRRHIHAFGQTGQTQRSNGNIRHLTCLRFNGEEFQAEISISRSEVGGRNIYTAILRDITEGLKAKESLRMNEARFRTLFENVPIAIWEEDFSEVKKRLDSLKAQGVTDFQTYFAEHPEVMTECSQLIRVLDVNRAAVELYKAGSKEELIESTLAEISLGEAEHNFEDFIAIAEGRLGNYWSGADTTMTGDPIQLRLAWSVVPDNEQDYSRVIVTTMDITELMLAQESVRRNERVLRLFVEHSPAAIAMFDHNMRYIVHSRRYVEDYQLPDRDLTGRSHYDVFPEIPERWKEIHQRCLAGAIERADEDPFPRTDGSLDYVYWEIHPWYDDDGAVGGIILFSEVITERVQAREAIRDSERQMRALVNSLDNIVFEFDAQGTYLNMWGNDESLLVQPKEKILGRHIADVLGEEAARPFEDAIKRVQAGGGSEIIEYPLEVINGSRWFMAQISPVQIQDEAPQTFSMFVRDITEQKQAEREIQQRTQDLTLINMLNNAANRGESVETITNIFTQEACSMFNCQDVALYLITPDGKYLEMHSNSLSADFMRQIEDFIGVAIPRVRLPINKGSYTQTLLSQTQGALTNDPGEILKWMLEFTETTFLPNVLRTPIRAIVPSIFNLLGIRSIITIPLVSVDQTIGLMDFSSANLFTQETLQRLLPLSRQMTAILQRKQAERKARTQIQRITALNKIDLAIESSLDMRLSLEVLLTEVVSQLDVDAADILLVDPVDLALEYIAGKGFRTSAIQQSRLFFGQGLAGKAGLERKVLHVPDLKTLSDEFTRTSMLKGEEFVEYFGVPLIAKGELKGVLEIFNRTYLALDPEWLIYLETLGGQAAIAIENAQLFSSIQRSNQELMAAYDATIAGWSHAMDLRDKETEGHTQRVTELTQRLAERMGVSQQEQIHIRRGALLHDIGKLGVPDHILLKPGKLTDEEWVLMRQHPTYAYEMLNTINYLRPALDIPYCHHEKWDGTGYPRGLKGEQIPLAARIFAIVDVWDALRSDRPYRAGWSAQKTRDYIQAESGKHFEPRVMAAFLSMMDDLQPAA